MSQIHGAADAQGFLSTLLYLDSILHHRSCYMRLLYPAQFCSSLLKPNTANLLQSTSGSSPRASPTLSLSSKGRSEVAWRTECSWEPARVSRALLQAVRRPARMAITCSDSRWSWSSFGVSSRMKTRSNLDSRALPILEERQGTTVLGEEEKL